MAEFAQKAPAIIRNTADCRKIPGIFPIHRRLIQRIGPRPVASRFTDAALGGPIRAWSDPSPARGRKSGGGIKPTPNAGRRYRRDALSLSADNVGPLDTYRPIAKDVGWGGVV